MVICHRVFTQDHGNGLEAGILFLDYVPAERSTGDRVDHNSMDTYKR